MRLFDGWRTEVILSSTSVAGSLVLPCNTCSCVPLLPESQLLDLPRSKIASLAMPAEPTDIPGHRRERNRSRSPWVERPAPISASTSQASAIYSSNSNQNTVYGSGYMTNINPNMNIHTGSGGLVHLTQVTNYTAPGLHPSLVCVTLGETVLRAY